MLPFYCEGVMLTYHNKLFRPVSQSENSETSEKTVFHYHQEGNVLSAEYSGGKVKKGHLIGLVEPDGTIQMCYHQVNDQDELMTGICTSVPEILPDGKIRLHETWQWTSGDHSSGTSTLDECE